MDAMQYAHTDVPAGLTCYKMFYHTHQSDMDAT